MKKLYAILISVLMLMLCASPSMGATAASLMPIPKPQFLDSVGNPLSGGKVYTCVSGVTCGPSTSLANRKATYTDSSAVTANQNPVILDSAGRANIWLQGYYKISLYTSAGVLVYTVDNVSSTGATSQSGWTVDADSAGNIEATVAVIGATEITMLVTTDQTVVGNLTIPANISTVIYKGNIITPASGKTVTFNGSVQAGSYQVFDQTSGGTVTVNTYPRDQVWWGSTERMDVAGLTVPTTADFSAGGSTLAALLNTAVPAGTVVMWATDTPPSGWLECNGSSLLRATYAGLFTAIGTVYGAADSTHFNLPDLRGRFMRGWDNSKGTDPDAATRTAVTATGATMTAGDHVGTEQDNQIQSHRHTYGYAGVVSFSATGAVVRPDATTNYNTGYTGGNETRPKNTNLMFIIKY